MDFVDNRLDEGTGTIVGRAVVSNPKLLLSPGMFVRLRLPGSGRYKALLVPDEAVQTDQSQKFVWVVDDENRTRYRSVQVGSLYDGMRIVREGLAPADRVVVKGVQRARPDIVVQPDEQPMPASAPAPTGAAAS